MSMLLLGGKKKQSRVSGEAGKSLDSSSDVHTCHEHPTSLLKDRRNQGFSHASRSLTNELRAEACVDIKLVSQASHPQRQPSAACFLLTFSRPAVIVDSRHGAPAVWPTVLSLVAAKRGAGRCPLCTKVTVSLRTPHAATGRHIPGQGGVSAFDK